MIPAHELRDEMMRAEGSANATEVAAMQLADRLGIPTDERRRLVENVGAVKALTILHDMVEAQTRYLRARVAASDAAGVDPGVAALAAQGMPRRPNTPETAIAYPEGMTADALASTFVRMTTTTTTTPTRKDHR